MNTLDFYEIIKARRSIRRYKADPVEDEKVERVLEAARLSPSWHNFQCWRFVLVRGEAGRAGILGAFEETNPGKKALSMAPVIIVLCADPQASGREHGKEYYLVDAGIAMEHLILAATAEGLGTCWMGHFDEGAVKVALAIPAQWKVVGITPLGFADQKPQARPRKNIEALVFAETWGAGGYWLRKMLGNRG